MSVLASAPGKAVLSGEYAVLSGAPAICMAVDRRATVRMMRSDEAWISVVAAGYAAVEGRFVAVGATPSWLQGEQEFRLVDTAWRELHPAYERGLSIELDTSAFFDAPSGAKVGLGSSAALTVALTAALTESQDVLEKADRVHRLFQSGAGSGVDIAASVHGGLIEYRMKERTVAPLRWPEGLAYRLLWTGVPVSTANKLRHLREQGHRRSRNALVAAAGTMATAWRSATELLALYPGYIDTLRDFSADYDLGIFDAGHDKLVTEARAAGLVYKPCGAGGGDVGILLGTNDEHLSEFLKDEPDSACRALESELATKGVTRERH